MLNRRGVANEGGAYFKDVSAYPMISKGEARRLGYAIKACSYAHMALKNAGPDDLTAGERAALGAVADRWRDCRDRLIQSNLRLVLWTVKRCVHDPAQIPKAVSDGNVGLVQAADNYDPDYRTADGVQVEFCTYAALSIRRCVIREYGRDNLIAIPHHVNDDARRAATKTPPRSKRATVYADMAASARVPTAADWDADSVPDRLENTPDPAAEADKKALVNMILSSLTERQRDVVVRRFGLGGVEPQTLEAVGESIGVTKERVRQIVQTVGVQSRRRFPEYA